MSEWIARADTEQGKRILSEGASAGQRPVVPLQPPHQPITCDTIKGVLSKLGIRIRLNLITGRADIDGMPDAYSAANAANTLPTILLDDMKQNGLKCAQTTIRDYLALIADKNRYNPVADMLTAGEWDRKDRLGELHGMLGIPSGAKESTYLIKWLWQCVALALNNEKAPYGADGVLVLQGAQGVGKSLFFARIAVCPEWFLGGVSIDTDKKDTIITSTGVWIAELGELDATLKREQSALKAFLTASKDVYRPPYAPENVHRPRRTSFCATVNPDAFLNDDTGSRRYWVIHVDSIDLEALMNKPRAWFEQLWRQVYALYVVEPQGFRLTNEERRVLIASNSRFDKALPMEIELNDLFNWNLPGEQWQWHTTSDLKTRLNAYNATAEQIGRAMKKIMRRDERIQVKAPKNVKQYFVPLERYRLSG